MAKSFWRQFVYNWKWADTMLGWMLGFLCGLLTLHTALLYSSLELWQVTSIVKTWAVPGTQLVGAIFFSGRMWVMARAPRPEHLDENGDKIIWHKLGMGQMIVMTLRGNYASLTCAAIAITFAVALAPNILTIVPLESPPPK